MDAPIPDPAENAPDGAAGEDAAKDPAEKDPAGSGEGGTADLDSAGEAPGPLPPEGAVKKDAAGGGPKATPRPGRKPLSPAQRQLLRAFRSGRPVQARVKGLIKGGYEVEVGKIRGFVPFSQMDLDPPSEPESHVGKTHVFRILQFRRGGDDLVLSRRALLEEERAEEAKAVWATLVEGHVMWGRVRSLAPYGAFVDLGAGVTGLVHVSELSHRRVDRPEEAVQVGERVAVKILRVDEERKRISLSIRQAVPDPWAEVPGKLQPGDLREGTVTRLVNFGAFVELLPGVEALAHERDFPPSREGWRAAVRVGEPAAWRVLNVDAKRKRIAVAPGWLDASGWATEDPEPGQRRTGWVQRAEPFGVFVWLGPGRVGLMPAPWSGTAKGTDLRRRFQPGQEIEVEVVETGGGKIRLAAPGAARAPEAPAPDAAREGRRDGHRKKTKERPHERGEKPQAPAQDPGAFGTNLGEALRAALGQKGGGDEPTPE